LTCPALLKIMSTGLAVPGALAPVALPSRLFLLLMLFICREFSAILVRMCQCTPLPGLSQAARCRFPEEAMQQVKVAVLLQLVANVVRVEPLLAQQPNQKAAISNVGVASDNKLFVIL
jgi:hypothetical protein